MVLEGQCHCGAITATLFASKPANDLKLRACQCEFCRQHGAITVADAAGRAVVRLARSTLIAYQFATRTSRALVCGVCGIYAGALLEEAPLAWSVLNVRGLGVREFSGRIGEPVCYDGETASARTARRKAMWTPTQVEMRP